MFRGHWLLRTREMTPLANFEPCFCDLQGFDVKSNMSHSFNIHDLPQDPGKEIAKCTLPLSAEPGSTKLEISE